MLLLGATFAEARSSSGGLPSASKLIAVSGPARPPAQAIITLVVAPRLVYAVGLGGLSELPLFWVRKSPPRCIFERLTLTNSARMPRRGDDRRPLQCCAASLRLGQIRFAVHQVEPITV